MALIYSGIDSGKSMTDSRSIGSLSVQPDNVYSGVDIVMCNNLFNVF